MYNLDILCFIIAIVTNNWKENTLSSILLILTSLSIGITLFRICNNLLLTTETINALYNALNCRVKEILVHTHDNGTEQKE